jgi:hypothetical protein
MSKRVEVLVRDESGDTFSPLLLEKPGNFILDFSFGGGPVMLTLYP